MVNNTALDIRANLSSKIVKDPHQDSSNTDGPFDWNKENQGNLFDFYTILFEK